MARNRARRSHQISAFDWLANPTCHSLYSAWKISLRKLESCLEKSISLFFSQCQLLILQEALIAEPAIWETIPYRFMIINCHFAFLELVVSRIF